MHINSRARVTAWMAAGFHAYEDALRDRKEDETLAWSRRQRVGWWPTGRRRRERYRLLGRAPPSDRSARPIDQPSSSTHTREALGWEPTHPSLLEDLECLQP